MTSRRSVLLFVLLAAAVAGAQSLSVETTTTPPQAPPSVRQALQATGYRVTLADGSVEQIWFRTDLPAGSQKEVEGANYPQLVPGSFVGVMSFAKPAKDFRGQSIKPGTYTLRYELLPNDGNHMGVAPNRDFLLLVPIADDPGPATAVKSEQLVKLSAAAAASAHPAVFSLVPAGASSYPSIYRNDENYVVLAAKVKTSSGELPIALVVKGVAEQ